MPSTRKARTPPAPLAPPIPSPPPRMYASVDYLASMGVTDSAQMRDAAAVYAQINSRPWMTQDDLVGWANQTWQDAASGVDRLNAAVALLRKMGKVESLG